MLTVVKLLLMSSREPNGLSNAARKRKRLAEEDDELAEEPGGECCGIAWGDKAMILVTTKIGSIFPFPPPQFIVETGYSGFSKSMLS